MYSVPDFSGRYEGTLLYEFRNEKCEVISETLGHIKVIVQNGSDVVINSWTKKKDGTMSSKSTSIETSIVKEKTEPFLSSLITSMKEFWARFCTTLRDWNFKISKNGDGKAPNR